MKYEIVIRQLSDEDGGGFVGFVPDLQGCLSDGDTPEEALANTLEAVREWLDLHERLGRTIPAPGSARMQANKTRMVLIDAINLLSGDLNARLGSLESETARLHAVLRQLESATTSQFGYSASMSPSAGLDQLPNVH